MKNYLNYEFIPNRYLGTIKIWFFMNKNTFDAIVIGAGMTGGWSGKRILWKRTQTLLLERGRDVKHIVDYPTTNKMPWEFKFRGRFTNKEKLDNPVASSCYTFMKVQSIFLLKMLNIRTFKKNLSTGLEAIGWR